MAASMPRRRGRSAHIDGTVGAFRPQKALGHARDESGQLLVLSAAADRGLAEHQGLIFVVEIKHGFGGDQVTGAEQPLHPRYWEKLTDAAAGIGIKFEPPFD